VSQENHRRPFEIIWRCINLIFIQVQVK